MCQYINNIEFTVCNNQWSLCVWKRAKFFLVNKNQDEDYIVISMLNSSPTSKFRVLGETFSILRTTPNTFPLELQSNNGKSVECMIQKLVNRHHVILIHSHVCVAINTFALTVPHIQFSLPSHPSVSTIPLYVLYSTSFSAAENIEQKHQQTMNDAGQQTLFTLVLNRCAVRPEDGRRSLYSGHGQ